MKSAKSELVERYRRLLRIDSGTHLTEEMLHKHWQLEKSLAKSILESDGENRWQVTQDAYRTYYDTLAWLVNHAGETGIEDIETDNFDIVQLCDPAPKDVYEVGAGTGKLLKQLAERGHHCKGGDIFPDRGLSETIATHDGLSFGLSDGVHLDQFESPESYDIIISDNVFEHLHPDDSEPHLCSARKLLKPGGFYIMKTPNALYGPHGLEKVFGIKDQLIGFHLKEYTIEDIYRMAKRCGYGQVKAVFLFPRPVRKYLPKKMSHKPHSSRIYLTYLRLWEWLLTHLRKKEIRKILTEIALYFFFPRQVFVVMTK